MRSVSLAGRMETGYVGILSAVSEQGEFRIGDCRVADAEGIFC